jgi:hypothetical protein
MLRRIFGSKGNEVIWEWRKLHNDELNYLYSRNRVLVGKREGKETTWETQAWMGV